MQVKVKVPAHINNPVAAEMSNMMDYLSLSGENKEHLVSQSYIVESC